VQNEAILSTDGLVRGLREGCFGCSYTSYIGEIFKKLFGKLRSNL